MARKLFLLLALSVQHVQGQQAVPFSCGVGHATAEQLADLVRTTESFRQSANTDTITVPVCSFIMLNRSNKDIVTDDMLQNQMDYLNQGFSAASCCDTVADPWCTQTDCSVETNIRFAWAVVTPNGDVVEGHVTPNVKDEGACSFRLYRPFWVRTNGVGARLMKRLLRKGGPNVLNVYWSTPLLAIGYAVFPPMSNRKKDGIVINPRSITGGDLPGYGQGGTLIHEVGHWLGLLHTFQGSCETSDGVNDTPMEFSPYRGCGELPGYPLNRDSCPDNPGTDPVHNFMDYSGDACWYKFTEGQIAVMRASWQTYRAIDTIALQEGQPSEPIILVASDRQLYSMISSDPVKCTASANEGEVGLYLQWKSKPRYIDFPLVNSCSTVGLPDQTCTARRPLGRDVLYIGVRSFLVVVTDLTVTCVKV